MTIELFTFCDAFGRAKSYSSVDELTVVKNSLTNGRHKKMLLITIIQGKKNVADNYYSGNEKSFQ
jgi:hypothetical protein